MTITQTLRERNKVHGDFKDDAAVAQALKDILHSGKNWEGMPSIHREALHHICTKIARILSGDPNHKDHWTDIEGYARLINEHLSVIPTDHLESELRKAVNALNEAGRPA